MNDDSRHADGVRRAGYADLPGIVNAHQEAFEGFFLTQLGPGFLREYYRAVLDYAGGILLTAEQEGLIVGFAAGFTDPPAFYAFLRRRKMRIGIAALPSLVRHPGRLARFIRNYELTRDGGYEVDSALVQDAEMSSIGVRPTHQGQGWGGLLLAGFERAAMESGGRGVWTITDAVDNDAVNQMYLGAGYKLMRILRRPYGRVLNVYRLVLGRAVAEGLILGNRAGRSENHGKE